MLNVPTLSVSNRMVSDATNKACTRERDFCIRHFAGDVVYNTCGFVEKNNDNLFHDLKRVMYNSKKPFLQSMWPEGADRVCLPRAPLAFA